MVFELLTSVQLPKSGTLKTTVHELGSAFCCMQFKQSAVIISSHLQRRLDCKLRLAKYWDCLIQEIVTESFVLVSTTVK